MPTINISGQQPGQTAPTAEEKSLKALYDSRMQQQIRSVQTLDRLRRSSSQAQTQGDAARGCGARCRQAQGDVGLE